MLLEATMCLDMLSQGFRVGVPSATHVTHVGFLPGMDSDVFLEVLTENKLFATKTTGVRFFPCVDL